MRKNVDFTVYCSDSERNTSPARYKIAAEWTGGGFTELKTFGFADDTCLERVFRKAEERAQKFRAADGESLGEMGVYLMEKGRHDYELVRQLELEAKLRAPALASR